MHFTPSSIMDWLNVNLHWQFLFACTSRLMAYTLSISLPLSSLGSPFEWKIKAGKLSQVSSMLLMVYMHSLKGIRILSSCMVCAEHQRRKVKKIVDGGMDKIFWFYCVWGWRGVWVQCNEKLI